jgi:hypothetical protein
MVTKNLNVIGQERSSTLYYGIYCWPGESLQALIVSRTNSVFFSLLAFFERFLTAWLKSVE